MSQVICPEECQKISDVRPQLVLEDRKGGKSQYRARNPKRRKLTVLEIDGCCIRNREACDFLLLVGDTDAVLLELKGSHVAKALRQIESTLDLLEEKLKSRRIHARVVPTRVPSPDILATAEIKLKRRLGGNDRYRCQARVLEETW